MKLIFCTACKDIVRLYGHPRTCQCGKAWGSYLNDDLHAVIGGPAIPLGIRNDEFIEALRVRPVDGTGSRFAAFVIPQVCDTVAVRTTSVRTSTTDPLRIATIDVPNGGAIGITFAPGKRQLNALSGGTWARNLEADLSAISAWGANTLVTLLEPQELAALAIPELATRAAAVGLEWYGLPITDGAAPNDRFLGPWLTLCPQFTRALQAGQRVVVHCKGGLGRAGTVACLLMHDLRLAKSVDQAVAMVRAVRPGAIETPEQETFLKAWYELRPITDWDDTYLTHLNHAADPGPPGTTEVSERHMADARARLRTMLNEALRANESKPEKD